MKKILFFILFLIILFAVYSYFSDLSNDSSKTTKIVSSPTFVGKQIEISQVIYKDQSYNYSLLKIKNVSKIQLISNLKDKVSAYSLLGNTCKSIISAGFYDKNDKHLGLFAYKDEIISKSIESKLFNGHLYLLLNKEPVITKEILEIPYFLALQSGPLLMEKGNLWTLSIINDEPARRVFTGINDKKDLYFGVIYKEEEKYKGPYLIDMPEIVQSINKKENLNLESAINLDGGSASVFYTDNIKLAELTTVGGFFCIK